MRNLKAWMVAGVLVMATASFAFVEKKPAGAKFTAEQSQEQVEQQQAMNGQYDVLGQEELVQPKDRIKNSGVDSQVSGIFIQTTPMARRDADAALLKAESAVSKPEKQGGRFAMWGILFLVLGAGAVWAFKTYADRVVPEMPNTPKSKIKW